MDISKVISSIRTELRLTSVTMPFKDPHTDMPANTENIILDVIQNVTIPRYSEFVPWIREGEINIKDLKCVDERQSIYMLPAFLTLTKVKYVIDISLPFHNNRGTYGDISPAYGINRSVQGVATSQAYMMIAGQMRSEPTFDYLGFNKVKLYGYPKTVVNIKLAAEHDPSGETIEESCFDSFLELATLDTRISFFNILSAYDPIPTAWGEYGLKLEKFQGADTKKEALLEEWRNTFHVDMIDYVEFM